MTITQIRRSLREAFCDRKYRITSNGEIHVYGEMPNTNQDGWYLFGWLNNSETEARIEALA